MRYFGPRYLFEDRRESQAAAWAAGDVLTSSVDQSVDVVLERLRRIDWAYPALLVYRATGEDRWSYVTFGLSRPELGED